MTPAKRKTSVVMINSVGLLLTGVIVIFINLLAAWRSPRWDMTGNKAYSLSPATRKLIESLQDPVIIKAYFTPDLPSPYNAYRRYVADFLEEYRSSSHGRVRYEFELSNPPEAFEQRATESGMMAIEFQQMGADQLQIRRGFMGLALYHRTKSEVIPIIKDVEQIEYEITSKIARMAERPKKMIGVVSGHGETQWQVPKVRLTEDLSTLYTFTDVSLPAQATSSMPIDALLVVGPKQKFDEASLWAIDQALMRGTPTAFLLDIENLMPSQFMVTQLDVGLRDLLRHYGVLLGDRLIYDAQCEAIRMTQNVGNYAIATNVRYPYIPASTSLARSHALLRGIDSMSVPFSTTIEPAQPMPAGVSFTPLWSSSPRSWLAPAKSYASVAPKAIPTPLPTDPHGPYIMAGVVEGTFTSYFQGKPSPVATQTIMGTSPKTVLIVTGTSLILNPDMQPFPGNETFISNLFAYMSKDDTLLGIRGKGDIVRQLKPLKKPAQEATKFGLLFGVPLLPVLLGLWRWRSRQAWRNQIAAAFKSTTGSERPTVTPPPAVPTA